MVPAIGITTQMIRQAKWYKFVGDFGLRVVEINRQNSKLHFNLFFLEKVKKYLEGFDLSIHSGTAGIFQPLESFTKANLSILSAEVEICHFLEARQFIFHLNDGLFSLDDKKRLQDVISKATDLGVEMLYESNSTLIADYAYDVLESFPDLGYVLDLGHLNNGYGSGNLGCTIDEFVNRVKNRVVYVHASNNSGRRDEHNGLESGTLDWRHVMDILDVSRIDEIIIEVRHSHMVENTKMDLLHYLNSDFHAYSPQSIELEEQSVRGHDAAIHQIL
jgi:sugar phosphate isomerase/epimerase